MFICLNKDVRHLHSELKSTCPRQPFIHFCSDFKFLTLELYREESTKKPCSKTDLREDLCGDETTLAGFPWVFDNNFLPPLGLALMGSLWWVQRNSLTLRPLVVYNEKTSSSWRLSKDNCIASNISASLFTLGTSALIFGKVTSQLILQHAVKNCTIKKLWTLHRLWLLHPADIKILRSHTLVSSANPDNQTKA